MNPEIKLYCNTNESVYTLLQAHKISAEGNKIRSESILMRTEKAGGQAREKVKAECDLFAKRASENGATRKKS